MTNVGSAFVGRWVMVDGLSQGLWVRRSKDRNGLIYLVFRRHCTSKVIVYGSRGQGLWEKDARPIDPDL